MRNLGIKILWVDLCKYRRNAQDVGFIKKSTAVCKIHSTDKKRIAYAIATYRPNLICIDYDFPGLPSLQLLRQLRDDYSNIPVVMLTTQHSESLAVWAFRTGVRNYLVKPLSVESIAEEISKFVIQLKLRLSTPRINLLKHYPIPKEFCVLSSTSQPLRTMPAIYYVETHFQEKIMEKEVADTCGMSVCTFSRIFRNEHNVTFREFLIKQRIAQAKNFLHNPDVTVTDVAHMSGFTDASSFARFFRRYIGISPSNYQGKICRLGEFHQKP
ncbi:response regulator transcription factor [Nitrosomonas sp.]|uniref:response regulator transcription factor n=1 Tax=Nitrosomonas sp. TaxID=42353 RepID=UPI002731BE97|nr:helix-turn-helix domain-containing protein [Nitrosomonas sp.]MDP1786005.1 helix-turn-helix domain-containing protein [Nitrosomonas sp.]